MYILQKHKVFLIMPSYVRIKKRLKPDGLSGFFPAVAEVEDIDEAGIPGNKVGFLELPSMRLVYIHSWNSARISRKG